MTTPQFRQLSGPGPERDLVGYGRWVPKVTWPNGARVALSIVLNWEEGSEVSKVVEGDGRSEAALGEIPYAMDPQYRDLAWSRSTSTAAAPASGGCSG